jgi:transposase
MADFSTETFTNLLGLPGFCALHILPNSDGSLQITVAAKIRMGVCPHCQSVVREVHQSRPCKDIHDLPLGKSPVRLKVLVDQYKCQDCHKAFTPAIPFLAEGSHATERFLARAAEMIGFGDIQNTAAFFSVPERSLGRWYADYVQRRATATQTESHRPITCIGIDELSLKKSTVSSLP